MKNFTVFWKITQAEGIDEPEKIVYDLPSQFRLYRQNNYENYIS